MVRRDAFRRLGGLPLVVALAWSGCGGSPTPAQGLPEKDGVPIGDCVEPSAGDLEALGCPATQPDPNATCSAPDGTVCRYGIGVETGGSYQTIFECMGGSVGVGARESCGSVCGMTSTKVVPIDATGCDERAPTECTSDGGTYAWPPSGLTKAQQELSDALGACMAFQYDTQYEIAFHHGCPVQLAISNDSLTDAEASCLAAALSQVRWQCALQLPCAIWGLSLI